ncbi:MAG: methionyl aminopeptidase [Chlamydiales bacterium]|nr:methionyl aminopeptidase [Chlamydiales bacterium]
MGRNDPCWCGSGIKWKKCHYPQEPHLSEQNKLAEHYLKNYRIVLKTPKQIEGIKRACKLAAQILDALCKKARAGVTTNELDAYAVQLHNEAGARAAPYHYGEPPFPKSICTSLNNVICHGIPNDDPLKEGDIMNIDVSVVLDGFYGDCSRMVKIGGISPEKQLVYDVSHECLRRAIEVVKPGAMLYEIGDAIEDYAAEKKCSVVHQFVGHGVGVEFHEPPQVPHHRNRVKIPLAPGMTFTIEPMINAGVPEAVIDPVTQWIATTKDGKPSAQWEHTILVTDSSCEILTSP